LGGFHRVTRTARGGARDAKASFARSNRPCNGRARTLQHPFSCAAIRFAVVRDDANANRFRVIRAILIAIGSSTTRFREVVQNFFLRPSVDESDAIPSSRGAHSCAARRIAPTASSARRACKKSAIYKGFSHLGKIGDELARGTKVFAALDKKFAASRCASSAATACVNASLRRESVFFIAL
jgi:hypothetical protein